MLEIQADRTKEPNTEQGLNLIKDKINSSLLFLTNSII